MEHDREGHRWFRPKKVREHTFFLCAVCQLLFDSDGGFKADIGAKASKGGGSE